MEKDMAALVEKQLNGLEGKVAHEILRLCSSGAVSENTGLNTLIGVALENIADSYLFRKGKDYRNLKRI